MAPVGGNKKKLWFSLRLCVCVYAWVFVLPCCLLRTSQLHLDELLFLCCSFFSCRKSWYCFTLHFNFKSPTVLLDHSLMSWRSCQEVQIKVLKWPPPPTHLSWALILMSWKLQCRLWYFVVRFQISLSHLNLYSNLDSPTTRCSVLLNGPKGEMGKALHCCIYCTKLRLVIELLYYVGGDREWEKTCQNFAKNTNSPPATTLRETRGQFSIFISITHSGEICYYGDLTVRATKLNYSVVVSMMSGSAWRIGFSQIWDVDINSYFHTFKFKAFTDVEAR